MDNERTVNRRSKICLGIKYLFLETDYKLLIQYVQKFSVLTVIHFKLEIYICTCSN